VKLAYIIFDGITWLDLIGIYDPLSRLRAMNYLPDLTWDICAYSGSAKDDFGLQMSPTQIRPSLSDYDAIIIPGGHGTRELQFDAPFIDWIKTAGPVRQKISICTGSLILGAAGLLTGRSATTHYREYEALKPYCREVLTDRIVEDQDTLTAGAVTASIDLGLYLCRKWSGKDAEEEIRRRMAYRG